MLYQGVVPLDVFRVEVEVVPHTCEHHEEFRPPSPGAQAHRCITRECEGARDRGTIRLRDRDRDNDTGKLLTSEIYHLELLSLPLARSALHH